MRAPVGLKALSGNDASIEAWPPLLQADPLGGALKLQLCSATPTVMKVPNGCSTCTVATPFESNRTHPLASGVPSRLVSTVIEKPSLAIMSRLLVSVSSQRT